MGVVGGTNGVIGEAEGSGVPGVGGDEKGFPETMIDPSSVGSGVGRGVGGGNNAEVGLGVGLRVGLGVGGGSKAEVGGGVGLRVGLGDGGGTKLEDGLRVGLGVGGTSGMHVVGANPELFDFEPLGPLLFEPPTK